MTEALVARLNEVGASRFSVPQYTLALNFVCGALVAYDASRGGYPYRGLDVERVFAAVELLARRRDLEVTPFVSAWHPAVDEWDRAELPQSFDSDFAQRLSRASGGHGMRDAIVGLIKTVTRGGHGDVYRELMRQMVDQLVALLSTTSKNVTHLVPLVRAGASPRGITIATLNYDLSVEQAASVAHVPVHTGITDWAAEARWSWPDEGVRLLKLHGSIDWGWKHTQLRLGHLPQKTVVQAPGALGEGSDPALVFGAGGKMRADGPFLSLLAEFDALLAGAQRLVVVGYSFRDDHVNESIRRWVGEDASRHIVVIDPTFPERAEFPIATFRDELMHALRADQWGEGSTYTPRLEILRQPASAGLRQLFLPGNP